MIQTLMFSALSIKVVTLHAIKITKKNFKPELYFKVFINERSREDFL